MKQRIPKPFYEVGDRVRVVAETAPECRTGYVTQVALQAGDAGWGYRVVHDRGEGSRSGFNWTEQEIRSETADSVSSFFVVFALVLAFSFTLGALLRAWSGGPTVWGVLL